VIRDLTTPEDRPSMFGSELTTMIEAGAGLIVGTVDSEGAPRGIRAWGARVVDVEGQRVRIVLTADDRRIVDNLSLGRAAFTAADVRTLRSVQLKGRVVTVEPPTPDDVALTRSQIDRFFEVVNKTDGNPLEQLELMLPTEMVAIEVVVDEEYDQTPGPTAGAALRQGPR
jgi:hypothetical protein